jgi:hypothetical protein
MLITNLTIRFAINADLIIAIPIARATDLDRCCYNMKYKECGDKQ